MSTPEKGSGRVAARPASEICATSQATRRHFESRTAAAQAHKGRKLQRSSPPSERPYFDRVALPVVAGLALKGAA